MKRRERKKLTLDKIKIAKLNNSKNIIGGYTRFNGTRDANCNTEGICLYTFENCSTKTAVIRYTAHCDNE